MLSETSFHNPDYGECLFFKNAILPISTTRVFYPSDSWGRASSFLLKKIIIALSSKTAMVT